METYPGDNCHFAPGMSDPPVASSDPSEETIRFTLRILDGDPNAARELKLLAEVAEQGEFPVRVSN